MALITSDCDAMRIQKEFLGLHAAAVLLQCCCSAAVVHIFDDMHCTHYAFSSHRRHSFPSRRRHSAGLHSVQPPPCLLSLNASTTRPSTSLPPLSLSLNRSAASSQDADESEYRFGWFHTGDQGQLDEDGYLSLVRRRTKEMINPV